MSPERALIERLMAVSTRYGGVVKLQEAPQVLATPTGRYTANRVEVIAMPVQRTTLLVQCAHCGVDLAVSPTKAACRVWCIPCIVADPKSRERIYAKVVPGACGCCRVWSGNRQRGYGFLSAHGQRTAAHRMLWLIERGPVPDGLFVCHDCPCSPDNRICCEPSHMFLGTSQDNMQDASRKGRTLSGERHPGVRLSESQVIEILRRLANNEEQRPLAREYGVAQTTIAAINIGRTWKHLPRGRRP